MPISDAKKRSNKKWNDANMKERYDRIQLVVPKGRKADYQDRANKQGESLNMFVVSAVEARIEEIDDAAGAEEGLYNA